MKRSLSRKEYHRNWRLRKATEAKLFSADQKTHREQMKSMAADIQELLKAFKFLSGGLIKILPDMLEALKQQAPAAPPQVEINPLFSAEAGRGSEETV